MVKTLAKILLKMLSEQKPGSHAELKHHLWMFIHGNKVRRAQSHV